MVPTTSLIRAPRGGRLRWRAAVTTAMIATTAAYVFVFGRITLGLLFAFAGAMKVSNLTGFVAAVEEFRLLPPRLVTPFAVAVVFAEMGVATLLLAGIAVGSALAALLFLLTMFTLALVWSIRRGRPVACRCFGQLSAQPASWGAVSRNVLLLAVGAVTLASGLHDSNGSLPVVDVVAVGLLSLGALALFALMGGAGALVRGRPLVPSIRTDLEAAAPLRVSMTGDGQ